MALAAPELWSARELTVAVRPAQPRVGTTHTYELNGTLLRDVLVEGRWVTVSAGSTTQPLAA